MKRAAPIRRSYIQRGSKFGNKRCQFGGRIYDSRLEAAVAADFHVRLKAGEIEDLREQVRHELFTASRSPMGCDGPAQILGWCSCATPGRPAPDGFTKFRGIRLDFQYTEGGAERYADAKGFQQRDGGQIYAYKLFELIHGSPIRLIRKGESA